MTETPQKVTTTPLQMMTMMNATKHSDIRVMRLRHAMGLAGLGIYHLLCEVVADYGAIKHEELPMWAHELGVGAKRLTRVLTEFDLFTLNEVGEYTLNEVGDATSAVQSTLASKRAEAGRKGAESRWQTDGKTMANAILPYSKTDGKTMAKSTFAIAQKENEKENEEKERTKEKEVKEKEKEKTDDDDDIVRACACTCEADLTFDITWIETLAMRYSLTPMQIAEYYKQFELDCKCRDKTLHKSVSDKKRHFADWLRIQINSQQQKQKRYGNQRQNADEINAAIIARATDLISGRAEPIF